jgi:hypothetical protein
MDRNSYTDATRLDALKHVYNKAYWEAWDAKADIGIERDSVMNAHAHEAGLKAVILAVAESIQGVLRDSQSHGPNSELWKVLDWMMDVADLNDFIGAPIDDPKYTIGVLRGLTLAQNLLNGWRPKKWIAQQSATVVPSQEKP